MSRLRIVAVSGSTGRTSRTTTLTRALIGAVREHIAAEVELIELSSLGAELGATQRRDEAPRAVARAIEQIESADILIAATPVYRGSYSGLFKHLFDLIEQDSLVDVPVILAAAAGGQKHCLVIEHELRPLFAFFQAFVVPTGVYAVDSDFDGNDLVDPVVRSRVALAAHQAARIARRRSSPLREPVDAEQSAFGLGG